LQKAKAGGLVVHGKRSSVMIKIFSYLIASGAFGTANTNPEPIHENVEKQHKMVGFKKHKLRNKIANRSRRTNR